MTTYETMELEQVEDVLTVTLNRKNNLNAMNLTMIKELIQLCDWLREERSVQYVVFTNQGRIFSAGADVFEMFEGMDDEDFKNEELRRMQLVGQEMIRKLESLEQITVAAINGSAYGGAVAIALTADFRLLTENSVLNLPETNIGLFLTWGCTPRLVKTVGALKAKEMIMLCEDISAEESVQWGLVNKVVAKEQLKQEVDSIIAKLRTKGSHSIRLTKKMINASAAPNFGEIVMTENELVEKVIVAGETKRKLEEFHLSKQK
ncbi:enoyl-CoA hydratase/isomerase family protein [Sporosarcina sp. BI001-red]|uniref:enoyl-CoA hydratase/isomerase family protein n=1 Tax=Sporosarcina sp. BI001-red TaxID=2282866 RepID=UPI000E24038D|nr:enoyl-CoA hydratase/isomerase family protein [Sporosarcina sp. BI001-red]REB08763.1 enoyl-CoA hydratase/isomerase family protein [Sporosarcina sp. BI001-red]